MSGAAALGTRFTALAGSGGAVVSGDGAPEGVQGFLPGAIYQTRVRTGVPYVDSVTTGSPGVTRASTGVPYVDDVTCQAGE